MALLLLCSTAFADIYTITITVTNAPTTNGMTLVVGSVTKTWTNSLTTYATQIATNATIGGSATNLFYATAAGPYSGLSLLRYSTNGIQLYGTAYVAASLTGDWGEITYATNTQTASYTVTVPMSGVDAASRTNVASLLASDLATYSTNAIPATSTLASWLVGISNNQTISGVKTFSGQTYGADGTATNSFTTKSQLDFATITKFDTNQFSATSNSLYIKEFATVTNLLGSVSNLVSRGSLLLSNSSSGISFYDGTNFNGRIYSDNDPSIGGIMIENDAATARFRIVKNVEVFNEALAQFAVFRIQPDDSDNGGDLSVEGDSEFLGTSTFNDPVHVKDKLIITRSDITSIAGGANTINPSTNTFIKLSGNTNAASIVGVSGGENGRILRFLYNTNHALTIANESGLEVTATNRIYTGTGSDITFTNNPVAFSLIYDSSVSRWILDGFNAPSIATGGDVYLAGTNTFTGNNTFTNPIVIAEPSATNHAATKAYVDANSGGVNTNSALLNGTNTFTGTNTFADVLASSYAVAGLSSVLQSDISPAGNIPTFSGDAGVVGTLYIGGEYGGGLTGLDGNVVGKFAGNYKYAFEELFLDYFISQPLTYIWVTNGIDLTMMLGDVVTIAGYTSTKIVKRRDASTNTLTIIPPEGSTIDGLTSIDIPPLCSVMFTYDDSGNWCSTLDTRMCLPTWMDERVPGPVLGLSCATPKKADAYPGAPYKVPLFDAGETADFTVTTTRRMAVTNVWFPKLTYAPALLVKLTDTPTAGQTNITVAIRYRLCTQSGTFGSLLAATNTLTLAATNTLYRLDFGTVTNNALSGVSGAVIEGGLERLTGGDGDITDDVVTVESLLFTMPFEVPLGSQNRTGD